MSSASNVPGFSWKRFTLVAGPGLVVMLADTDAGSIITAAQSGAEWGYSLLALQLILVPILYVVQELTVRLGLVTGRGHGELIRQHFGSFWAWVSVSTLVLACLGALVSELSGIAGVAQLFGLPVWPTMMITVTAIITMVLTGSYRTVERAAIMLGLFELAFIVVACFARPDPTRIADEIFALPLQDPKFLYLAAANIGAVIMPWMVFYQQSAVVDKGLGPRNLKMAQLDTVLGAILTQAIMSAVLISVAAIGSAKDASTLEAVPQIADALVPVLGGLVGRGIFALGMCGAALVATVVVCLAAAWGIGEVAGFRHSLEDHPVDAPWFYGIFSAALCAGGILVASGINLVSLAVGVEVVNALLLPIVLGFLFLLARNALEPPYRLEGPYAVFVFILILATAGFALYAGLSGALA